MFRQNVMAFSALSITQQLAPSRQLSQSLSLHARHGEKSPTAQWLESVKDREQVFPLNLVKIEYSRSSGAGGQNVNKVNTKATLFAQLDVFEKHLPRDLIAAMRTSSAYYKPASDKIVIQSDRHRGQKSNQSELIRLLDCDIRRVATEMVTGEARKGPPKQPGKSAPTKRSKSDSHKTHTKFVQMKKKAKIAAQLQEGRARWAEKKRLSRG